MKIEFLKSSYKEHLKFSKELSYTLPIEHPKRRYIEKEMESISEQIKKMEKSGNKKKK